MTDSSVQLRSEPSVLLQSSPIAALDGQLAQQECRLMHEALRSIPWQSQDLASLAYAEENGLGRALLWGGDGSRFSLWAFRWRPGCETPIHDHHCACAFTVAAGQLEERVYRLARDRSVVETGRAIRRPGTVIAVGCDRPYIHSMHPVGDRDVFSVHLYAFDPACSQSSVLNRFAPPSIRRQ